MGFQGELAGFPVEIVNAMLNEQALQNNKRDITVFEINRIAGVDSGGFDWGKCKDSDLFWRAVISDKEFKVFFDKYPKIKTHKDYKEGDLVIITEFRGDVNWINHWFEPNEVLKLGGRIWKGSLRTIFAAKSNNEPNGNGMNCKFEKNYKIRKATDDEINNSQWAIKDHFVFPEKWVIEGDYVVESHDYLKKDHWFYSIVSDNRTLLFLKDWYYSKETAFQSIPSEYTLVTKEQLIKHFNIKTNEVQRQNQQDRRPAIQGRARLSSRRQQGAVGSRPKGNLQTTHTRQAVPRVVEKQGHVIH